MGSVDGGERCYPRTASISTLAALLFLIAALQPILGSYPFFWRCPTHFPVQQNFSTTKYAGRWYEIEKFFELEEFSGSCTVSEYTSIEDGKMSVDIFSIHKRSGMGKFHEGRLTPTNVTKKEGRFKLDYKPELFHLKVPSTYWVLATDYGNYSLVWSCKNSGIINFQGVWFLSRRPRPTDFIRSIVYNKLRILKIFTRILTHTDQKGCPRLGHPERFKEIGHKLENIEKNMSLTNRSSSQNEVIKNADSSSSEIKINWTGPTHPQPNETAEQPLKINIPVNLLVT